MKKSPLLDLIAAQNEGVARGLPSICSANAHVLKASFAHARANDIPLLIESTCNQVNQFGGYTGQTPFEFMRFIQQLADAHQFPLADLVVGGDHLGPNPWRAEPVGEAMEKSKVLVRDYVRAGYSKIHLDTSMKCADDDQERPLPTEIIAARSADLALAAEVSYHELPGSGDPPFYVIGTEVPAPGGTEDSSEAAPVVTLPSAAQETIDATRDAFRSLGLESAWERVIGLVVQPGVEYGGDKLFDYDSQSAQSLSRFIERYEGLVFEAHSTDYQTPSALRQLVRDHYAILKVGPALTFALREAVFALAQIENIWLGNCKGTSLSNIREVLEEEMLANPKYWQPYYPGDECRQRYARQYSLSDRLRYYWPLKPVQRALDKLLANLAATSIPLPLLSQYLPDQFRAIRDGRLRNVPSDIIAWSITAVLDDYASACGLLT